MFGRFFDGLPLEDLGRRAGLHVRGTVYDTLRETPAPRAPRPAPALPRDLTAELLADIDRVGIDVVAALYGVVDTDVDTTGNRRWLLESPSLLGSSAGRVRALYALDPNPDADGHHSYVLLPLPADEADTCHEAAAVLFGIHPDHYAPVREV